MVQYHSKFSVDLLHGETITFIWKAEPFAGTHLAEFVAGYEKKIPKYKQKYNYLEDKRLYWDMRKMEIGSLIIYYSKQNAKTKKAEEAVLQQKLSSLHKLLRENPMQETIANDYEVKAYGGLERSIG